MSTLQALQLTLKRLYMSPEGKFALADSDNLEDFLATHTDNPDVRNAIRAQALPRLEQYRFMLRENAYDALASTFPYTEKLLGDRWASVIADYVDTIPCQHYQITAYGTGFPDYLAESADLSQSYPCLVDLARYELLEAELLTAPDPVLPADLRETLPLTMTDLETWAPVFNETASFLQCEFAIQALMTQLDEMEAGEPIAVHPKPSLFWIFRSIDAPYGSRYFELNMPLAIWLTTAWDAIQADSDTRYSTISETVFAALQPAMPELTYDAYLTQLLPTLAKLKDVGILRGSRTVTPDA